MMRKRNLMKIPLFESINAILKDVKNNKLDDDNININEKCKTHPEKNIFFICIDCQVKMCEICDGERKKHENHHLINFEKYIKLFSFIQDNLLDIKQNIADIEKNIRNYKKLIVLAEQQKNSYLKCLTDLTFKIQNFYQENINKMNQIIADNMATVAKSRNFMLNLKIHISSKFKNSYDDIEDIEDIKNEIKQSISKFKLKKINKYEFENTKKNVIQKLTGGTPMKYPISFKIKALFDNSHVKCIPDKDGLYTFGLELSEDKKIVNVYLDVKKIIKNQTNISSYVASIEYGKKHKILYLELTDPVAEDLYSYEKNIGLEELIDSKDDKADIILNIISISLK